MTSPAASVEEYLAAQPPAAQEALREVRRQLLAVAVPGSEAIRYGMPAYRFANGRPVYFAGWKQHLSLHDIPSFEIPSSDIPGFDDSLEAELAPFRSGKDTLKFPYRRSIPFDLIERTLRAIDER